MADRIEIDLVPKITAATMAALKGQLGGLLAGAGGVVGQIGSLATAGGHPAGALVSTVGAVIGAVGTAITTITETTKELVGTVADFAKAASPSAFQQFEFVLKDINAVVGRMFVPVLQTITGLLKVIGDFLLAILPSAAEVRRLMAGFAPLLEMLRTFLAQQAPALRLLVYQMIALTVEVGKATAAYAAMIPVLAQITPLALLATQGLQQLTFAIKAIPAVWLLEMLGKVLPKQTLPSSAGMGGRPMAFLGVEEYGRQVRMATGSVPGDPATQTATNTKETNQLLRVLIGLSTPGMAARIWDTLKKKQ